MECQSGENASDDDLNIDSEILATKHKLMSDEESDEFQFNLFVHLKHAVDLAAKKNNGTSDPFVKFQQQGKILHKSKVVHKNLDPVWDESFMIIIENLNFPLEIKVVWTELKMCPLKDY